MKVSGKGYNDIMKQFVEKLILLKKNSGLPTHQKHCD
nr:MAG TPA: hypothetical protein [Caudoviricetes sp.]